MNTIKIKTPDFIREQLSTYQGLVNCCEMLTKVFHVSYSKLITNPIDDHQFSDLSWIHREFTSLILRTYTGKTIPAVIVIEGGILDCLLTGAEDSPVRTADMILTVFDEYMDSGLIDVGEDDMSLFKALRKSLIEIVTRFYTNSNFPITDEQGAI